MKKLIAIFLAAVLFAAAIVPVYAEDTAEVKTGDVNGDGKINIMDCSVYLRYLAGWDTSNEVFEIANADWNQDGKVNLTDVSKLLVYLSGWPWMPGTPTVEDQAWRSYCSECSRNGTPKPTFDEWLEDQGYDPALYYEWFNSDYKPAMKFAKWYEEFHS